jgi:hypothetical protein
LSGILGQRSGGHNSKSREAHRLAGTFRPDRHGNPPALGAFGDAPVKVPRAPAGLSVESRRLWTRIHREYAITSCATLELLESALRSRDLAERARLVLESDGLTFTDKNGQPKAHPAAQIHRDARAAFVSTLRVLGFPSQDE